MRKLTLATFTLMALFALVVGSAPRQAKASSHREAPFIATDPEADASDLYAFVSPDKPDTVTFVADYVPLQDAAGGPNFYKFGDDVLYEINIDNVGDAKDHINFQWRFSSRLNPKNPAGGNTFLYNTGPINSLDDPNLNRQEFYSLSMLNYQQTKDPDRKGTVIKDNLRVAPANVGPVSYPNGYEKVAKEAIYNVGNGMKAFAGPRDDPFFADLGGAFDLLSGIHGSDFLKNKNVHSLVLQVPISMLKGPNDSIIGVRTTSYRHSFSVLRPIQGNPGTISNLGSAAHISEGPVTSPRTSTGPWVQISRLDNPLVNEVVIPLQDKNRFNGSLPINDTQFLSYVLNPEIAGLEHAILGLNVPPNPRNDLVTIFLTGLPGLNQPANVVPSSQLRLNMDIPPSATPNRLGVLGGDNAGYPNGRRLTDDAIDISLQAAAGATPLTPDYNVPPNNTVGDMVDNNDVSFLNSFPYAAMPHDYRMTEFHPAP
ncbi:MAG: DUF4331 domain-containing protein [Herpetosiphonaceae bacterium]|nr:DUF4331 domain-containing protein [Herpetosiphonaceae bacterium]